jgi:ATP-dependent RNA helicase RhlB
MNSYSIIQVFCVVIFSFLGLKVFRSLRKSDTRSKKVAHRRGRKRRVSASVSSSVKTTTTTVGVEGKNDNDLSHVRFDELGLDPRLLRGIEDAGFKFCTPIQARSLPSLLRNEDIAGQAQTGTGKTAAYLLATMHRLFKGSDRGNIPTTRLQASPRALILAPTRELAIQIKKDADVLGTYTGFKLALIYGGVDYEKQRKILQTGVDIIIGTPGRIIDFYKQNVFSLNYIEALVLDEADRMFDLGFIKDLRFLLRRMPHPSKRLNMLYSATLSHRVNELAYEYMNTPKLVEIVSETRAASKISQVLYHVSSDEKISLLVGLLNAQKPFRTIIFANTKRVVSLLVAYLNCNGYQARALSGDVEQAKRQRLIDDFKIGKIDVVVATDVAARGLHIPDVTHVVNYDLPNQCEDYVHRIGRTARAGASGDAISLACEEYVFSLQSIEEYIGHKILVEQVNECLLPDLIKPVFKDRKYPKHRKNH